jgi:hypothetical protein
MESVDKTVIAIGAHGILDGRGHHDLETNGVIFSA